MPHEYVRQSLIEVLFLGIKLLRKQNDLTFGVAYIKVLICRSLIYKIKNSHIGTSFDKRKLRILWN